MYHSFIRGKKKLKKIAIEAVAESGLFVMGIDWWVEETLEVDSGMLSSKRQPSPF